MKTNRLTATSVALNSCLLGMVLSAFALGASAAPFQPYPNPGAENTVEYTFSAATSGDIVAYFAGNGGAAYSEALSMLVNGVSTGVVGLNNHDSAYGQALDLGYANAGDTIVFSLSVATTGNTWYSDKSRNADGANHVYATTFSGDGVIPAGNYVGFEDVSALGDPLVPTTDFNYADEQFVFTNVVALPTVPIPATAWLFGSGLLGLVSAARRKFKTA